MPIISEETAPIKQVDSTIGDAQKILNTILYYTEYPKQLGTNGDTFPSLYESAGTVLSHEPQNEVEANIFDDLRAALESAFFAPYHAEIARRTSVFLESENSGHAAYADPERQFNSASDQDVQF